MILAGLTQSSHRFHRARIGSAEPGQTRSADLKDRSLSNLRESTFSLVTYQAFFDAYYFLETENQKLRAADTPVFHRLSDMR
jgi:hypothetical protein